MEFVFVQPLESRQLFAAAPLPALSGFYAGTTGTSFGPTDHFSITVLSQNKAKVVLSFKIVALDVQGITVPDTLIVMNATVNKKGALKGSKTVPVPIAGIIKPIKLTLKLNSTVPISGDTIGGGGALTGKANKTKLNVPLTFSLTRIPS